MSAQYQDYGYHNGAPPCTSAYLLKEILALCGDLRPGTRVLDVGCGNGALAKDFVSRGCRVVGIELSRTGIEIARWNCPEARFEVLAADDKILENLGEPPFDLVVSTEVIEHLYCPRAFAIGCLTALQPGGRFVCSTPYHGYAKNLLVALLDRFDTHFNPLWDGGHIKFWSRKTLFQLLAETGFTNLRFRGAGRLPFLWKSMVLAADRPFQTMGKAS